MLYFPRLSRHQELKVGSSPGWLSECSMPGRYSVVDGCLSASFCSGSSAGITMGSGADWEQPGLGLAWCPVPKVSLPPDWPVVGQWIYVYIQYCSHTPLYSDRVKFKIGPLACG